MDKDKAVGIAARIWCDHDMEHIVMDHKMVDEIVKLLQTLDDTPKSLSV